LENQLTYLEAFKSIQVFLEKYPEETKFDGVSSLYRNECE